MADFLDIALGFSAGTGNRFAQQQLDRRRERRSIEEALEAGVFENPQIAQIRGLGLSDLLRIDERISKREFEASEKKAAEFKVERQKKSLGTRARETVQRGQEAGIDPRRIAQEADKRLQDRRRKEEFRKTQEIVKMAASMQNPVDSFLFLNDSLPQIEDEEARSALQQVIRNTGSLIRTQTSASGRGVVDPEIKAFQKVVQTGSTRSKVIADSIMPALEQIPQESRESVLNNILVAGKSTIDMDSRLSRLETDFPSLSAFSERIKSAMSGAGGLMGVSISDTVLNEVSTRLKPLLDPVFSQKLEQARGGVLSGQPTSLVFDEETARSVSEELGKQVSATSEERAMVARVVQDSVGDDASEVSQRLRVVTADPVFRGIVSRRDVTPSVGLVDAYKMLINSGVDQRIIESGVTVRTNIEGLETPISIYPLLLPEEGLGPGRGEPPPEDQASVLRDRLAQFKQATIFPGYIARMQELTDDDRVDMLLVTGATIAWNESLLRSLERSGEDFEESLTGGPDRSSVSFRARGAPVTSLDIGGLGSVPGGRQAAPVFSSRSGVSLSDVLKTGRIPATIRDRRSESPGGIVDPRSIQREPGFRAGLTRRLGGGRVRSEVIVSGKDLEALLRRGQKKKRR